MRDLLKGKKIKVKGYGDEIFILLDYPTEEEIQKTNGRAFCRYTDGIFDMIGFISGIEFIDQEGEDNDSNI